MTTYAEAEALLRRLTANPTATFRPGQWEAIRSAGRPRLTRVVAFAVEGLHEVRSILRRRGLSWALLIVLALNLVAAAV